MKKKNYAKANKKYRKELGLSAKELAKAMNCHWTHVYEVERNNNKAAETFYNKMRSLYDVTPSAEMERGESNEETVLHDYLMTAMKEYAASAIAFRTAGKKLDQVLNSLKP